MAEGRSEQLWQHTSVVLCFLANGLLRGSKQAAFTPEQFNPYTQGRRRERVADPEGSKQGWAALKRMVLNGR